MIGPWLWIGIVLAAVAVLIRGTAALGRAHDLHPELQRKVLHFGSGLIALSFPWLFDEAWPVLVISSASVVGLLSMRFSSRMRDAVGGAVHAVRRRSLGDLLVPVAIATLFLVSSADRLLYTIPLLILTAADGAAALIALRYGMSPYPTIDGRKTVEGTATFLVVAFLTTLVPLQLASDLGRAEVMLLACIVALVTALIEAASWSGLDNLSIPIGAYVALRRGMDQVTSALVEDVIVLTVLSLIVFVGARRARLSVQARLCALAVGFFVWAFGGVAWLAPLIAVMLVHSRLVVLPQAEPHAVDVRAILSVASAAAVWLSVDAWWLTARSGFYAYTVAQGAHLAMTADVRSRALGRSATPARTRALWIFVSTFATVGFHIVYSGFSPRSLLLACFALPIVALASVGFGAIRCERLTTKCWTAQAVLALAASAIGLAVDVSFGGAEP